MPKASRGCIKKKQKTEKVKKVVVKTSKKSKCVKTTTEERSPSKIKCDSDSDELEVIEADLSNQCEIDDNLERNASKNNLSVFNVKSILHHVLSDKRVVAMARKAAEDNEDDDDDDDVGSPDIEPKLTRSRFREVSQATGATNPLELVKEAIIHSPLKNIVSPLKKKGKSPAKPVVTEENVTENLPLGEINFSEGGSSDEEYVPLKDADDWEESEEDSESNLSNASDMASPEPLRRTSRVKRKLLSDPVSSPPQPAKRDRKGEVDKSGDEYLSVSPFKVPFPVSQKTRDQKEQDDLIASRTRSRLPLNDTSLEDLEADFLLPDCSPDMYDLINLDDLDSEDLDWQKWLSTLTSEKGAPDDVEDTEYNFMANDEKEEKEEYRNDRAVQISQKELTELFEEFLNEFGDEIDESELDNSQTLSTVDENALTEEPDMTYEQKCCVIRQLQQHTQLLVQINLLTRVHESLKEETLKCSNFLNELIVLSESNAKSNINKISEPSVFSHVGLSEALRLINRPLVTQTVPESPTIKHLPVPPTSSTVTTPNQDKQPPLSPLVIDILRYSPIFVYTGLLPERGFRANETRSKSIKFLQAEDNLLVLGLDQFGLDWVLIQKHYLPTKTDKQIMIRRKNLCSNRAADNVIKQFRDTKVIPKLPVTVNMKAMNDRNRVIFPNKELVLVRNLIVTPEKVVKKKGRKRKVIKPDVKQPVIKSDDMKNKPLVEIRPKQYIVVNTEISDNTNNLTMTLEKRNEQTDDIMPIITRTDQPRVTPPESPSVTPSGLQVQPVIPDDQITIDDDAHEGLSTSQDNITIPQTSCDNHGVIEKENIEIDEPITDGLDGFKESLPTTENDTHEYIKTRDRATAFAQSYLSNVKKCLKDDNSTYNAFLEVLLKSKCESWSPAKLYNEVAVVLESFPELVCDFVGFLEPHHAHEVGMFMTNNKIIRARTFLKRLEGHFQKNPSHFQKIIKAFTTYNFNEPKPTELYDAVVPLLKGQQYLVDEFNSFFGHFPPRLSDSDDFEEVELGSGSDIEIDDFETITIPGTKKTLIKERNHLSKTSSGKLHRKQPFSGTRKENKLKKQDNKTENEYDKSDKINENMEELNGEGINEDMKDNEEICGTLRDAYDQKTPDSDGEYSGYKMNMEDDEGELRDDEGELRDDVGALRDDEGEFRDDEGEFRDDEGEFRDDEDELRDDEGEFRDDECEFRDDEGEFRDDEGELSNTDPMSPMKKSDQSDQSSSPGSDCKFGTGDEFLNLDSPGTTQGSHMTSSSGSISDLSNEACDIPSTSGLENDAFDCDVTRQQDFEDDVDDVDDDTIGNPGDVVDRSKETEEDVEFNEKADLERISANNLEIDKDGKSFIVWTREEDKKILELYQNEGFSENIFHEISQELGNRTTAQVEGRFHVLISLLTANNDSSSEESGTDEGSYEDDKL